MYQDQEMEMKEEEGGERAGYDTIVTCQIQESWKEESIGRIDRV